MIVRKLFLVFCLFCSVLLSAQITVPSNSITLGEYFWDTDPGEGNGTPLVAFDGNWDESMESVSESISSLLFNGYHTFNIRVKDADGVWGYPFIASIFFNDPSIIYGCTDSTSLNYDPLATLDDGSCSYPCLPDTSFTYINVNDSLVWNGITYDSSGTYTYNGSSTTNNSSASLDGINDYINVGNNNVLNIDNSVTIETWINAANLSNRNAIYSTRKNNDPGSFQLEIGSESNVGTSFVAVTGPGTWIAITGSNVINNNSGWVHIAYTRDGVGDNHEIYINGIPQAINTNPYTFANNNALKEIGRGTSQLQNYEGKIDQVSIWNIALSQQEIQNYMNCSPQGNEAGLVGCWNFEEGSGNTAYDQTSNGNDGIINGATYDTNVPAQSCQLTNSNGCDSIAVLNLTINQSDTSYTNITACDSAVWNGTTYTQSGTYSYCGSSSSASNNYSMSFDGVDDYIPLNYIDLSTDFTIFLNFKANYTSGDYWQPIISNIWNTYGFLLYQYYNPSDGLTYLKCWNGSSATFLSNLSLNTFYSLTLKYSSGYLSAYLDGTLVYAGSMNILYSPAPNFLNGARYDPNGSIHPADYFTGNLDNFSYWNTPLSMQEIQDYMNCPPIGTEAGLVGYWNFEEGSGTTAFDLTSNGNNGTLNGATYDTDAPSQLCPFTNTAGCDSVAILNLTIGAITGTDTQLACNSYTWIDGNTYTTNNNNATFNIIGGAAGGCDSLVTLNLTIVNSTIPALNLGNDTTICNGSVLVLDAGLTYDTYNWSTSDTTQTIAVNSAGTYFVEVASNTNASTGPNLITNSDFSSNGAFWNACGNTTEAYAPETTYGGSNATNTVAEIDAGPDNTIGTADDMSLCQTVVGLTIGQSYQLCFNYSRRDIGPNPTTTFITIDGGSLNQTLIASNSTFAFTQACYTFTATQTTHLLSFTPGNSGQEGMILDDISTHILTSLSCYTSDTIQVFVETPVQTVSFSNPICFGDNNGNIYVDNALAFEYSSDGGTNWQIDSFFVNLTSGNYSICSRTALGCTVCDIVILNSLPQISGTDTRTECNSYTWIDGNTYTANNNSATFNIVGGAANGCDSLVTLDLTINNVSDLTTSSSGAIITANNLSATYQWLDCDSSNVTITGETGQSYTAVANGNYAVELTENGCVDTSACVAITSVGIIENDFGDVLSVYPNPTNGNFSIDLGSIYESSAVKIVDISGKLIDSKIINQSRILNLTIEAPSSIYIVSIQAGEKKAVIRLVKE